MSTRITRLLMGLFFLALGGFLLWKAIQHPRVLVVQSYATDYRWTRETDQAIRDTLRNRPFEVKYHYMDTKNHSDAGFKRVAGNLVRRKVDQWNPDLLLLMDDNAQSLVGACYARPGESTGLPEDRLPEIYGNCHERHPEMKIVFSGVGATVEDYGYDGQEGVSGVLERMDVRGLQDVLLYLARELRKPQLRVLAPMDDSTSAIYNRQTLDILREEMAHHGITIEARVIADFAQWQDMVAGAEQQADLLLFSNYHTVRCGTSADARHVPPADLIAWTLDRVTLPNLGAWGFFMHDGGMLAVGVSPMEQGEVAAQMAIDIVSGGRRPADIPVYTSRMSMIYLREALLREAGLELPHIYVNFARATGNFIACEDAAGDCAGDLATLAQRRQHPRASPCEISGS